MRNSYEIVGYAHDGYVLCPDCEAEQRNGKGTGLVAFHDPPGSPIFLDEEEEGWNPTCDYCNEEIFQ